MCVAATPGVAQRAVSGSSLPSLALGQDGPRRPVRPPQSHATGVTSGVRSEHVRVRQAERGLGSATRLSLWANPGVFRPPLSSSANATGLR